MSNQAEIEPGVGYALSNISLLEVSLKKLAVEFPANTGFGFRMEVNQRVDIEGEYAEVVIKATLVQHEGQTELANIAVGYRYNFQNMKGIPLIDGNLLPRDLADILNNIAISTTRGIIFSEFRGTNLGDKFLPLINPANLASNSEVVK